jgi:hypothetical protein
LPSGLIITLEDQPFGTILAPEMFVVSGKFVEEIGQVR